MTLGFLTEPHPKDELSDCRAEGIQHRVLPPGLAAGHERLMHFVQAGVKCRHYDGFHHPRDPPSAFLSSKRAKEHQAEDKIFGHVSGFADQVMDISNRARRCRRKQPSQERFDHPRSGRGRKMFCREYPDHGCPAQGGPPLAQPAHLSLPHCGNRGKRRRALGVPAGNATRCGNSAPPW